MKWDPAALGSELVRLGSILRLNPEDVSAAFPDPTIQLPLIMAALSRNRLTGFPAFIESHTTRDKTDHIKSIDVTITSLL